MARSDEGSHDSDLTIVDEKSHEGMRLDGNALHEHHEVNGMEVIAIGRRALATGPVCDACLGRCVADRSHGLSNRERGYALRVVIALIDDTPLPHETRSCWVCEGICDRFDELADMARDRVAGYEFESYQVGTRLPVFVAENDRLLREEARGGVDCGEALKSECNREVGKRLGASTDTQVDFERPDLVVLLDLEQNDIALTVNSAFVYGRYRKLERGIPQTKWPCSACDGSGWHAGESCDACDGSGFRYDRSVEQLVAPPIERAMEGADATFHGAGREDIDALMLGTGRPFVVEIDAPRVRSVDLDALQTTINAEADGAVEVEGLHLATYEMVEHVKETEASKTYRATVTFEGTVDEDALESAIDHLSGSTIAQETPTRVSHRRAALTREREVHRATLVDFDTDRAVVEIHGEGGLYIKELLHGDEGRTDPSLAALLDVPVEVVALDVVTVEAVDEDRFADPAYLQ